jgi:hypothetical protein
LIGYQLPTIDGERTDLHFITETMTEILNTLRLREAKEIFSEPAA